MTLCLAETTLKSRRKWQDARGQKDGVTQRKRAIVDLFSTPGMSCKPGKKPEAEKPPGMAESSEGLEVARAEVKAPVEATSKVSVRQACSHLLPLETCGDPNHKPRPFSASMATPGGLQEVWKTGFW